VNNKIRALIKKSETSPAESSTTISALGETLNQVLAEDLPSTEIGLAPTVPAPPSTVETTPAASGKATGRVIMITPDVRLSQQDGEVVIEQRKIVERGKHAGEERWIFVGAYGSLEMAASTLVGRHYGLIQPEHVTELKSLIVELKKATTRIIEAFRSRESV